MTKLPKKNVNNNNNHNLNNKNVNNNKLNNINLNNNQNETNKSIQKQTFSHLNSLPLENKREIIKKIIEEQLKIHTNGITYLLKKNNSSEYKKVKFYKRNNIIMVTLSPPKIPEAIKKLKIPELKQEIINITRENYRRIFNMEMSIKSNFFKSNIKKDELYKMYVKANGIQSYTLEEIEKRTDFDIYEIIQLDTIHRINNIDLLL